MQDELLASATKLASSYNFDEVLPEHILYAMSMQDEGRTVMTNRDLFYPMIRVRLLDVFKAHNDDPANGESDPKPSQACMELFNQCDPKGFSNEIEYFGAVLDVIRSNTSKDELLDVIFEQSKSRMQKSKSRFTDINHLDEDDLDNILEEISDKPKDRTECFEFTPEDEGHDDDAPMFKRNTPSPARDMYRPQSTKRQASVETQSAKMDEENRKAVIAAHRNLSEEARQSKLDVIAGRDMELSRITEILMRRRKPNVLLVAEPGVGKSALIHGLAQDILDRGPDGRLFKRPVKEVSLTSMVAGTRLRGDFEGRMSLMVQMAEEENAILFIDEFHTIMGSGTSIQRGLDGVNIIKPALARDRMSLIGATTPEEALALREDKALMRRFEIVYLKEPNREDMYTILSKSANSFLSKHGVTITPPEINRILDLGERHIPTRRNPDRSFDILDLAGVGAMLRRAKAIESRDIFYALERLGAKIPSIAGKTIAPWNALHDDLSQSFIASEGLIHMLVSASKEAITSKEVQPISLYGPNASGRRFAVSLIASSLNRSLHHIDVQSQSLDEIEKAKSRIALALEADPKAVLCLRLSDVDSMKAIKEFLMSDRIFGSDGAPLPTEGALAFMVAADADRRAPIGFAGNSTPEMRDHNITFSPLDEALAKRAAALCFSQVNHDYDIGLTQHQMSAMLNQVMSCIGSSSYWSDIHEAVLNAIEALDVGAAADEAIELEY